MNQPSEKTIAVLDNIVIVSLFVLTAFSMFSISITQISGGVGGLPWLLRTHLTESWSERGNLGASAEIILKKTDVDFVYTGEGEVTILDFVE